MAYALCFFRKANLICAIAQVAAMARPLIVGMIPFSMLSPRPVTSAPATMPAVHASVQEMSRIHLSENLFLRMIELTRSAAASMMPMINDVIFIKLFMFCGISR